jgi:DNA-binding Xre family transcriptional regulator
MENEMEHLMKLTVSETAEFDKMADVLSGKLGAISRLDTQAVQEIVIQELEVLKRIQTIEKERACLLHELSISGIDLNDLKTLENKFGIQESNEYRRLHLKLKESFMRVQSLNGICRALLNHSLSFIKHNIHILTDGGNRKLVDRRA